MYPIDKLRKEGDQEKIRDFLKKDHLLPEYHIYPFYGGFLNDVNAFFRYKGKYHLFFQYSYKPNGMSPKEWQHAVSDDLVHWRLLEGGIRPDAPYDKEGVWSGHAFFDKHGNPAIVYYAFARGLCIAYPADLSDEDLKDWVKEECNPVIPDSKYSYFAGKWTLKPDEERRKSDYTVYDVSNIWYKDGYYYLLSGNKDPLTDRPANYLHRSKDLKAWEFVGAFVDTSSLLDKDDIACPNMAIFPDGQCLYTFSSHYRGVKYFTGRIDGERFSIEGSGSFNYYGGNEMGQGVFIEDGKGVYMSWLTDAREGEEADLAGWCGVLTIPRSLTLTESGKLIAEPHENVYKMFGESNTFSFRLNGEKELPTRGRAYCLRLKMNISGGVHRAGVKVAVSKTEYTEIYYDVQEKRFVIDVSHAERSPRRHNKYIFEFREYEPCYKVKSDVCEIKDGKAEITVFVDHTVIEVYACGMSMSKRIYPSADACGIKAVSLGDTDFEEIKFMKYIG